MNKKFDDIKVGLDGGLFSLADDRGGTSVSRVLCAQCRWWGPTPPPGWGAEGLPGGGLG